LDGIVHVAALDADEAKSLASAHGVRGFPTIKLFYVRDGALKSSDYNGGRAARDIVAWAIDKARALAFKRLGEKAPGGSSGGSGGAGGGGSGSCGGGGGGGGGMGGMGGCLMSSVCTMETDGNLQAMINQSFR